MILMVITFRFKRKHHRLLYIAKCKYAGFVFGTHFLNSECHANTRNNRLRRLILWRANFTWIQMI